MGRKAPHSPDPNEDAAISVVADILLDNKLTFNGIVIIVDGAAVTLGAKPDVNKYFTQSFLLSESSLLKLFVAQNGFDDLQRMNKILRNKFTYSFRAQILRSAEVSEVTNAKYIVTYLSDDAKAPEMAVDFLVHCELDENQSANNCLIDDVVPRK